MIGSHSDEKADSDLAIVKTWRYHFDDEPFTHPLHSDALTRFVRTGSPLSLFRLLDVETLRKVDSPTYGRQDRVVGRPVKSWELFCRSRVGCARVMMSRAKERIREKVEKSEDVKGIEERDREKERKDKEEEEDPEEDPSKNSTAHSSPAFGRF
ncbi:hypothetical protein PIB30_035010 [Stylosanthes scabra]|uniref:Uncharacterized protein n=1 Tax=Stylosanthes scabra TaxID=79078 RepID=A0ABU6TE22_9FABA|nr:hypothetical protein [Stylosanthes scabra]